MWKKNDLALSHLKSQACKCSVFPRSEMPKNQVSNVSRMTNKPFSINLFLRGGGGLLFCFCSFTNASSFGKVRHPEYQGSLTGREYQQKIQRGTQMTMTVDTNRPGFLNSLGIIHLTKCGVVDCKLVINLLRESYEAKLVIVNVIHADFSGYVFGSIEMVHLERLNILQMSRLLALYNCISCGSNR